MTDITGSGIRISLIASNTYPAGITLTQFADDADPFDVPSIRIADTAMGVNGDMVSWNRPVQIPVTLNMVPNSEDDLNLEVLANANRVGKGKASAVDVITLTAVYPDGRIKTAINGKITDYLPALSVAGTGRIKTRPYAFAFESMA